LFAGVVNAVAVVLCATGQLGPIGAAFTHQLSSFFVMLNSLRLLRVERGWPRWIERRLPRIRLPKAPPRAAWDWLLERRRQLVRPALVALSALVVLNGFYTVNPDEVGVIERFGKKVLPHSQPGMHYKLPWPVERLTRIQARRVRVVEIGFRSSAASPDTEPAAYEWNVQHRSGRFQKKPEESLMVSGDQNMMEVNATVHYSLARPDDFLFRQLDGDTTVRAAAESVMHAIAGATALDDLLTTGRREIERKAKGELQRRLDRYSAGVTVLNIKLQDVHPSLEVVDAFREVSGAFEEKNRMINEAEGYRNEQIALARGNAKARIENAAAYTLGRKNRAAGDASRFVQAEAAFRAAPGVNETRLYLETMEQVLPGRNKMIVEPGKGRRHLLLMEDGVEIPRGFTPAIAPERPPLEREESE
jgi:HflK protein